MSAKPLKRDIFIIGHRTIFLSDDEPIHFTGKYSGVLAVESVGNITKQMMMRRRPMRGRGASYKG